MFIWILFNNWSVSWLGVCCCTSTLSLLFSLFSLYACPMPLLLLWLCMLLLLLLCLFWYVNQWQHWICFSVCSNECRLSECAGRQLIAKSEPTYSHSNTINNHIATPSTFTNQHQASKWMHMQYSNAKLGHTRKHTLSLSLHTSCFLCLSVCLHVPCFLLCFLPNISIFLPPGHILSSSSYISSGFLLLSLNGLTITSQSKRVWNFSGDKLPFTPIKQCSLLWFNWWPVKPWRISRFNWLIFTQINSPRIV